MKLEKGEFRRHLDQFFEPSRTMSAPDVEPALERLLDRQHDDLVGVFEGPEFIDDSIRMRPSLAVQQLWFAAAVAVVAVVPVVLGATLWLALWPRSTPAVVESVDARLFRVVEGRPQQLSVGDQVDMGEVVQASGSGGTLVLADGSRVEMRSQSQLALEHADDGIRIRLKNGRIIVSAAKQPEGHHLFVETKDALVSVVGTVFVVNTEAEGSSVSVIEGEVRVRQATSDIKLGAREQVVTNSAMESLAVKEEVSWSHYAEEHQAKLQQIAALQQPLLPTPVDVFDLVSVRSLPGPGVGVVRAPGPTGCPGGAIGAPQINPGRLTIPAITVFSLITMAYGQNCMLVEGGPDWVRSDFFEIQAIIPSGSPAYSRQDLAKGTAPKLQGMLQSLLLDRFKLEIRREMKEMSVYALAVARDGKTKIKLSEEQTAPANAVWPPQARGGELPWGAMSLFPTPSGELVLSAHAMPMSELAKILQAYVGRAVIDKTELKGFFDIRLQFAREASPTEITPAGTPLASAIQEQLGLRLESARAPVETLVIESAARPSAN